MLPNAFEIHVPHGGQARLVNVRDIGGIRVRREMTGANAAGDVQALEAQVAAAMDDANVGVAGCQTMATSDVQAWAAIYQGWQAWDQALHACIDGTPSDQYAPPTIGCVTSYGLNWQTAMAKLATFQNTAQAWQARVHAACASYKPLPTPTPSGPPGSQPTGWWCRNLGWGCGGAAPTGDQSTSWPTAIKWVAIVAAIGIGAYYIGPLLLAGAAAGAGAISKHTGSE